MRLIINILLIAALSYYVELYLPWWTLTIVCAAVCTLVYVGLLQAFISGCLGIGLLWFGLAWKVHADTEGVLSEKITQLVGLGDPLQLIVLTGLVGGLVGGLAAMTGSSLRNIYTKRRHLYRPYT